jgi:hypothetical protein
VQGCGFLVFALSTHRGAMIPVPFVFHLWWSWLARYVPRWLPRSRGTTGRWRRERAPACVGAVESLRL